MSEPTKPTEPNAPQPPTAEATQTEQLLENALGETAEHDKAEADRAEQTIEAAVSTIQTPEQADKVIDDLERMASGMTERQVGAQHASPSVAEAVDAIQSAAETVPSKQPQAVIAEAARQIAAAEGQDEEALSQAMTQPGITPETTQPRTPEERKLLQEALLRRLSPLQAADTALFLLVNRLPRPRPFELFMYVLSAIMNRSDGLVVGLLLAALRDHRKGRKALLDVLPALWLTTATIEFPVKSVFRRRRPFISIVRAIVVGKKPGGYSFPSGHSASAFASAWLISRHYPNLRVPLYLISCTVAFSRVYLGAHYPGDVTIGALSGTAIAIGYRKLAKELIDVLDED